MNDLRLLPLTEESLDEMIEVLARAREDDPHERRLTQEEAMEQTFLDPDFDPEGAWLAVMEGNAVGFGFALVERNRIAAGKDDAYVEVEVVKEHRGEEVEERLLEECLEYVRKRGVGKALCRCLAADERKKSVLASCSFEEAYRVYILERKGTERTDRVPPPKGYRIEHTAFRECSDDDLSALVDAMNDAFQDHHNFAPERLERIINFRDSTKDPKVLSLAVKEEEIAGLCLCEESATLNEEKGKRTGWIDIIGVRPRHRRKGLARVLLAEGINWILDRGMDTVYLGVLAENEKALGLYEAFGFSKNRESIWFSKSLR